MTRAFLMVALMLASPASLLADDAPHSMADLRRIVGEAVAAKAKRLVIPPGVYRGTPKDGDKTHLPIQNAADLEITADGVTMICEQTTRAIDLHRCTNLTLRGITVDYDPLPFTQGDVVRVQPAEGWLDVKIHAGYPVEAYTRIDVVDRGTRYRKKDKPFMWESNAEVREGGVVRVRNPAAVKFAQVGDLISLGGYGRNVIPHAVVVGDSSHVTLSKITVHASNCMGIVASGGQGGHRLLGCRVVPGPLPRGAVEPRILSTCADAILFGSTQLGPLTEGCEIRDAGDDSWSIQPGDSAKELNRPDNGFVFRNNTVRSSGRILIKASGIVENNRIEGPFGLSVNPETPKITSEIARIVIRNNTIIDAHLFNPFWDSPQAGAISITAEDGSKNQFRPAGVYGEVVIENNTIQGGNGAGIVATSVRDLVIRGNRLVNLLHIPPHNTAGRFGVDNHAAIWLAECERVAVTDNELLNAGPQMSRPIVCGPGVQKREGELTKKGVK